MNLQAEVAADRIAMSLRSVSKTYPGTQALRDVSFSVRRGSVHALLGGNGSGKSTLIKLLAGVESPDPGGHIALDDSEMAISDMTPAVARRLGLRFVHQNPPAYPTLTVAENLAIEDGYPTKLKLIQWRSLNTWAKELLRRYEIDTEPGVAMGTLRPGTRTMVAIARALSAGPGESSSEGTILILDEPTASLPKHEADRLLESLTRLAQRGETIIFVSHRIDEVLAIADTVTVLRDGQHVITRPVAGMTKADLVEAILGRKLTTVFPGAPGARGDAPLLRVRELSGGPLRSVTLDVYPGEIVGIAGLLGSGRTTLLRALFGDFTPDSGKVYLGDTPIERRGVAGSMRLGIAYTPEDRGDDAAFPGLSLQKNLVMANIRKYWRGWRFDYSAEARAAKVAVEQFDIKSYGVEQKFASLSGGNQQKVVLARWLGRAPRLLLLDEPTQGVDVGTRADVFQTLRREAANGMSALVVSSDFEELAHTCDRVLVLRDGEIRAELVAPDITASLLTEIAYSDSEGLSA